MVDVGVPDAEVEPDPGTARLVRVVDRGSHLDTVDVTGDHAADDACLHDITVLHAELRALVPYQRFPAANLAVPSDDLRVSILGLEASPENLVPRATVRNDCRTQPDLDLLEVFLGLILAEHGAFDELVLAP